MSSRRHDCAGRSNLGLALSALLLALGLGAVGVTRAQDGATGAAADERPIGEIEAAAEATAAPRAPEPSVDATLFAGEQRELEEMEGLLKGFGEESEEYKGEIQRVVEEKYDEQRKALVGSFDKVISDLERQENDERRSAIEVFEQFLAKYPTDPAYTPSALWRLAELQYEKARLDYNQEEDGYDTAMAEYNRGDRKAEPQPPTPHFERTIDLLQRLVRDFPDYRYADGAYYLLAFCLQEQGENEEAQASYQAFTQRFPKSKYLPEVWARLGESYFEDPNKLDRAIAAYQQVLNYPDNRMYDKSIYKLAWTYYKVDRFEDAVERFDQLIAWADSGPAGEETGRGPVPEGGAEGVAGDGAGDGDASRTELRKESMQYLAISYAEDEWAGSGVENAKAFFDKKGGRKYDGEFFRKLGEVYFVDAKYEKSIAAYREAIRRYPLDPENPELMATIVDSHYRLQQTDEATRVQEELVTAFGPGSKWRAANQEQLEKVRAADRLTENALQTAAVRHHTLAQRFKEQQRAEEARAEYEKAALAYADYLKRFPDTRDAYRLTYYLAECQYYSFHYAEAAEAYTTVRDSAAGTEFLAESANAVVLATLNQIKNAEGAGELPPLVLYTSANRPKDLPLAPREIPAMRQKLIDACDAYVAKLPNDEQVATMIFKTANVYYAFDHFDEARARFARIVETTKDRDLVTSSINLIVESYLVPQDWEQVEIWSRKLASLSRDPGQQQVLKQFELGARFNKATEFMKAGKATLDEGKADEALAKLDAASTEFIRLVDDDPKGKSSDKALNNAALCLTWASRPVSAGKIYERIVKEYPTSDFADSALFLMAGSAESSYQFDRAIENYLRLVENYPKSKFRADALYNAAVALEGDQQYPRAARAYEQYARLFRDRPDAPDNQLRAGLVMEKQKDYREVVAIYSRFVQTYQRDPAQREKIVVAKGKIAEAFAAQNDSRRAQQQFEEVVKLYRAFNLPAGGRAAEAAATAHFALYEMELKRYEAITFKVPQHLLAKTLKLKAETLKKMEEKYKNLFGLKRVQWTLAGYYRLGYLYENFADVLVNGPCPPGLNQEECDVYKGKLEDFAEAPIKKAVSAFELTMEKSMELKVVNEWSEKAYASLNRFDPLKYPLQKEPEAALVIDRHGALPLLQTAESGIKPSGK